MLSRLGGVPDLGEATCWRPPLVGGETCGNPGVCRVAMRDTSRPLPVQALRYSTTHPSDSLEFAQHHSSISTVIDYQQTVGSRSRPDALLPCAFGMPRRRTLTMLAVAALAIAAGCTSPALDRSPSPGTVHARVVGGAGGARLLVVPVFFSSRGPYDFALDTGAARSIVDSRVVLELRPPTTGTEQSIT